MGALFAAVLLYPLDVAKTRQQVDVETTTSEEADAEKKLTTKKKKNMWMICYLIYQLEGIKGLFA